VLAITHGLLPSIPWTLEEPAACSPAERVLQERNAAPLEREWSSEKLDRKVQQHSRIRVSRQLWIKAWSIATTDILTTRDVAQLRESLRFLPL